MTSTMNEGRKGSEPTDCWSLLHLMSWCQCGGIQVLHWNPKSLPPVVLIVLASLVQVVPQIFAFLEAQSLHMVPDSDGLLLVVIVGATVTRVQVHM